MNRILFLIMVFSGNVYAADSLESFKEHIISHSLEDFWGNARLPDGSIVRADSQEERDTLPIPRSVALNVVNRGMISGLADWCGLDWKTHYLHLTSSARKNKFTNKQVAYIGFLHGIAMGTTRSLYEGKACTDEQRAHTSKQINTAIGSEN